tara:strand:+ start:90 stop:299 length:210 start_codon:yes stop_codon:yes gene_type:complete
MIIIRGIILVIKTIQMLMLHPRALHHGIKLLEEIRSSMSDNKLSKEERSRIMKQTWVLIRQVRASDDDE